jgi:hypothetical protein
VKEFLPAKCTIQGRKVRRGFGRHVVPDERDRDYSVRDLFARKRAAITVRMWPDTMWAGDQGTTPRCLAFALAHWIEDGPISPKYSGTKKPPFLSPATIYREAQALDGIPLPHDGTTLRAGAKVLQKRKIISSYHWAYTLAETTRTILEVGPMVFGLNWYEGMLTPDSNGVIQDTGEIVGSHGIECNGVDLPAKRFRLKNSWGTDWGFGGHCWLPFAVFTRLLKANGEAMVASEIRGRA